MSSRGDGEVEVVTVHGHRRAYVMTGSGPPVLLLHGLGGSHETWEGVIPALAEHYTVIAPDLLGHGRSDKPRADYSIGAYANGMRDLLSVLGVDKVTVIGHSFGGGVAMQFAYQYPERCDRLVLVATGGLGPEVSPFLRLLSVPGSGTVLAALTATPLRQTVAVAARVALALPTIGLGRIVPGWRDGPEILDGFGALRDPASRRAFLRVLRAAVDRRGQVITMLDRSYLAVSMPVLLVWGADDPVIPLVHARRGAEAIPGSELVVLDDAGHFPFRDRPDAFVEAIERFIGANAPMRYDPAEFRTLLRTGGAAAS